MMLAFLRSFITVVLVNLRGRTTVSTETTEHVYRCHLDLASRTSTFRTVYVVCHEYRHTTYYERWYLPTKVTYTYAVEMIRVNGVRYVDTHIGHYPQLCNRWIPNALFPHRCAVNAHVDHLIQANP